MSCDFLCFGRIGFMVIDCSAHLLIKIVEIHANAYNTLSVPFIMMIEEVIRAATDDDVPEILRICHEALHKVTSKVYSEEAFESLLPYHTEEILRDEMLNKTDYFVYVIDDRIAGVAGIDRDKGYLRRLYVDPGYHGQGIARKLQLRREERARERGFTKLTLHANLISEQFHLKGGFKVVERVVYKSGCELVIMSKSLSTD